MSAAAAANPVAVLRRAALLAGLLALIAGFLGMHIVAGSHGVHAQPPSPGSRTSSRALQPQRRRHFLGGRRPRCGGDRVCRDTRRGDRRRKPGPAVVHLPGRMRRDAGGSRRLHAVPGRGLLERPAARDHVAGGPALDRRRG